MLYVDTKYVNMLSSRVRNFKKTNEYTWNFSCPFCGDSKTNTRKARGYIHKKQTSLYFKCHNCGVGTTLGKLLNHVDTVLHKEYTLENYKEGVTKFNPSASKLDLRDTTPKFAPTLRDDTLKGLRRIDTMSPDHPAVKYVASRLIDKKHWSLLYFAPKWKKYVNSVKYTYSSEDEDHPRLVIPFFNDHGKVFAFQGRAFGEEAPRYMTIKLDDNMERIYGLERANFEQKIYAVEGPIDSLFLPNCIAVAGSSFDTAYMRGLASRLVVIFDNEPRNKDLCRQIEKCIKTGYSVCLFPATVLQKDINDMIKVGGKTVDEIVNIINTNTFTGLEATVRFNEWRKCNES